MRRAVLTIGLDLMECGDDSSGYLSHVMTTAMVTYAGTDWCSTGIPPQHFWPDFVKIATLLANYGVPVDQEVAVYRLAGVAPHPRPGLRHHRRPTRGVPRGAEDLARRTGTPPARPRACRHRYRP